jgi:hypothetical protein
MRLRRGRGRRSKTPAEKRQEEETKKELVSKIESSYACLKAYWQKHRVFYKDSLDPAAEKASIRILMALLMAEDILGLEHDGFLGTEN